MQKIFLRKDGSGDSLTLEVKKKSSVDPDTWIMKTSIKTVVYATLSGYSFRVPKKEYKRPHGSAVITGRMKNLAGSTAGG